MNLAQKFNNLNGLTVNRSTLQYLLKRAEKERNSLIQRRIIKVLDEYKDDEFLIEIKDLIEPYALNGAELDFFDIDEYNEKEVTGLNGIPQQEIYDIVTQKIIENLETATNWSDGQISTKEQHIIAINFLTKKPYRGINQMLLGGNPLLGVSLENPYYLTFNQVEKLGGKVNTGAKSQDAIFYTIIYSYKGFKTNDKQKFINHLKSVGVTSKKEINSLVYSCGYGILRIYNVFNGKDIAGIDWKLSKPIEVEKIVTEKIAICDTIIAKYPAPAPKFTTGGNGAYYQPSTDTVNMPKIEIYKDIRTFYAVYFHELVHSTGHSKRLNRGNDTRKRDGSKKDKNDYAFEELVAEIGASFLSANAGFFYFTKENAKSYINSWRKSIVAYLKEDNKGIFVASAKAQKAVDFMLQNVTEKDYEVMAKIEIKKTITPVSKVQKKTKKTLKSPISKTKTPVKSIVKPKIKVQKKTRNKKVEILEEKQKNRSKIKPIIKPVIKVVSEKIKPISKNKKVQNIGDDDDEIATYYKVAGSEGEFLQAVEKKPFESVVITLDGQQGAGKTTTLYKFMNSFAKVGNKCLFLSGEEHPKSDLAKQKVKKYLSKEAIKNIDTIADVENTQELYDLVNDYEIIFIDSWQKLLRMIGNIRLDEDLRKKFDGKVFVVIFQQTTTGRTKGGAEVVFDGDIIIKMIKGNSFSENYAFFDKNRYTKIPIENIRYNIEKGFVYNPNQSDTPINQLNQPTETTTSVFSFNVN